VVGVEIGNLLEGRRGWSDIVEALHQGDQIEPPSPWRHSRPEPVDRSGWRAEGPPVADLDHPDLAAGEPARIEQVVAHANGVDGVERAAHQPHQIAAEPPFTQFTRQLVTRVARELGQEHCLEADSVDRKPGGVIEHVNGGPDALNRPLAWTGLAEQAVVREAVDPDRAAPRAVSAHRAR
jgi:hypothetical protein